MAAIETKLPGFYTSTLGETQSWDEPETQMTQDIVSLDSLIVGGKVPAFWYRQLGVSCGTSTNHLSAAFSQLQHRR